MIFITPWAWIERKKWLEKDKPKDSEELTRWFSFESLDGKMGVDFDERTLEQIARPLSNFPKNFILKYDGLEWIPIMEWLQDRDGCKMQITSLRDIEGVRE